MSYEAVGSSLVDNEFPLTLYQSLFSGCKLVVVHRPSPLVSAQISIGTVTEDNSGTAHSLEHLSMINGSKNYPYSEFLPKIQAQCFGAVRGSTFVDSTRYTLSTVGAEGFFKLLPVLLDHLMNPQLTETAYKTEVHHIDGEGLDGGVVFSEMQARGQSMGRQFRKLVYGTDSPFARSSGGLPEAIREESSLEKIKAYHAKYYKMENMVISVVGTVVHADLLHALTVFETDNNLVKTNIPRFFDQINIEPFKKNAFLLTSNQKTGSIQIRWRGPSVWEPDYCPLRRLLHYFAHVPGFLKSSSIHHSNPRVCRLISQAHANECGVLIFGFNFKSVNPKYLREHPKREFKKRVMASVRDHNIDLNRLRSGIKDAIKAVREQPPTSDVASTVHQNAVCYHNYAPQGDTVGLICPNLVEENEEMLKKDSEYWTHLRKKYFTEDCVLLRWKPDGEKGPLENLDELEAQFIQKRKEKLGSAGLKKCAEELEDAIAANQSRQPPPELLDQFRVPRIDSIPSNIQITKTTDVDFVKMTLSFDGTNLAETQKPLIKLFLEMVQNSHKYLSVQSIGTVTNIISGNLIKSEINVSSENVDRIPAWLDKMFDKIKFTKKNILKILRRLTKAHCPHKNNEEKMSLMSAYLLELPGTVESLNDVDRNQQFYGMLLEKMKNDVFVQHLIGNLTEMVAELQKCPFNLHLTGNARLIDTVPVQNWPSTTNTVLCEYTAKCTNWARPAGKNYCILTTRPGPTSSSITVLVGTDLKSEHWVFRYLLTCYLNRTPGPCMASVRNPGMAYGAEISFVEPWGLCLKINRASNLVGAYKATRQAILKTIKSGKLDPIIFEHAQRRRVRKIFESIADNQDEDKLRNYRKLMKQINAATPEAVLEAVGKHILELFDDSKNCKAIVVPAAFRDAVQETFPNVQFSRIEDFYLDLPLPVNPV